MEIKTIKIIIDKHPDGHYAWYNDKRNQIFEVVDDLISDKHYCLIEFEKRSNKFIPKKNCIVIK